MSVLVLPKLPSWITVPGPTPARVVLLGIEMDASIGPWWVRVLFPVGDDFEHGQWLALFDHDIDDIVGGAGRQADQ